MSTVDAPPSAPRHVIHHPHQVQRAPTRVPRYVAPASLEDALSLLATHGEAARPIAGGTDLLVELDRAARPDVTILVDLGRIPGLDSISSVASVADVAGSTDVGAIDVGATAHGVLRIGALVTHNQVVASVACRTSALPLAQACLEVGSPQLRNRATVVGNIVTASPANDTISALVALGASVEVSSVRGVRTLPVSEFITGFRTTDLAADELVTAVLVPALGPNQRGIFVKLGLKRAQAISVVHLAATVTFDPSGSGAVTNATLALGSVAPTIVQVPGLDGLLRGRLLDAAAIADVAAAAGSTAAPIDDLRAPAAFRSDTVVTMTRRAFEALAAGVHASQWPAAPPLLWGAGFDGRYPTGGDLHLDVGRDDPITTAINGETVTATGAAGVTLLDWLRDQGIDGVKEGCAEGECGACTVDLDGASVMSCLVPAPRAAGATVVTVEGLADGDVLHPIQESFIECGAVQCGFCTPGLLMACAKLIEEYPDPDIGQVRRALSGNLCRCTGYRSIEAAVARVALDRVGGRESTSVSQGDVGDDGPGDGHPSVNTRSGAES